MQKNKRMDPTSTRSAENLVLTARRLATDGLGASASIVQIVESLIWPFVARRSRCETWFTDREFGRFTHSMRLTARRLVKYESEENAEQTFMKFWLDSLLCQVFQDPQRPPREPWIKDPLFSGWCRRFCARAVAKRDVSFVYSLQKGSKRGWPALGPVKEAAALAKHAERLSAYKGRIPRDLEEMIQFTSTEVFKTDPEFLVPTKFLPSGSACLQASRREGGALSLVERFQLPFKKKESAVIGRLPVLASSLEQWRTNQFAYCYEKASARLREEPKPALDVDVVAIPEPGKFRIITKGDGYLYSALQPLQGLLLAAWKRHPASTMRRDDLTASVQRIDRLVDLPFWCSVDYEAATDLLKRDATLAAFMPVLDYPGAMMGWESLFAGSARYPDGTVVRHIEGQLMGHPLSFPLLCVINLAVYQLSIERWIDAAASRRERQRIGDLMSRHVLVNGDDMLFKCDQSFYEVFLRTASDAGFSISRGKNYLSPDTCMINSQVFRRVSGVMKRFGYLNLKMVFGSSLKEGESAATPVEVGKDLGEMCDRCPWAACAIPRAFRRWNQDWYGPVYRPNWYLPVHLGGFGVPVEWAPHDLRITRHQRQVSAMFVADPRLALYRRKGMNLPTAELAGALANWRMVTGDYVHEEHESQTVDDEWLARLAYASRAHQGAVSVSDRVFVWRFFGEFRLKPMSIDGLLRYWHGRLFATHLPFCPPIGQIKDLQPWD